jgi:hypothetical protein
MIPISVMVTFFGIVEFHFLLIINDWIAFELKKKGNGQTAV